MVLPVVWSRKSLRDLDRLEQFLRDKNPRSAQRAIDAIVHATYLLAEFPDAGRPAEDLDPEHRELLVDFSNGGYVVRYSHLPALVEILDVRHQREDAW